MALTRNSWQGIQKCCQFWPNHQKFQFYFSVTFLTEGSKKGDKTKHPVVVFSTQISADCGSSERGKQTSKFKRPCSRKANTVHFETHKYNAEIMHAQAWLLKSCPFLLARRKSHSRHLRFLPPHYNRIKYFYLKSTFKSRERVAKCGLFDHIKT